jgi:hypothetical protein
MKTTRQAAIGLLHGDGTVIRKKPVTAGLLWGRLPFSVAVVISINSAALPAHADVSDAFTHFYGYVAEAYCDGPGSLDSFRGGIS